MWEIAALVEVLERKGVLTWQEVYQAIDELRGECHKSDTILRPCLGRD